MCTATYSGLLAPHLATGTTPSTLPPLVLCRPAAFGREKLPGAQWRMPLVKEVDAGAVEAKAP